MVKAVSGIEINNQSALSKIELATISTDSVSSFAVTNSGSETMEVNSCVIDSKDGLKASTDEIKSRFNKFVNVTTKYTGTITDKTGDEDITNAHFEDAANGDYRLTRVSPIVGKADPALVTTNGPGGR